MAKQPLVRLMLAGATFWGVHRLSRRSGVSDAEFIGPLPGDEVIPAPMVQWTRGTTIDAPPEVVWPWLVQMGFGRGGWYTNERFDRVVWRLENKSSDVILPKWQNLKAGDIVPDGPGYAAYFHVKEVEENEAIVYHSIRHPYRGQPLDPTDEQALERRERELIDGGLYLDFSWVFVLKKQGNSSTRLLVRTRATFEPPLVRLAVVPLGLVDLFHVATMFHGIKRRAENRR